MLLVFLYLFVAISAFRAVEMAQLSQNKALERLKEARERAFLSVNADLSNSDS